MNEVYHKRIRRILTCHVTSLSAEQGAELKALIDDRVKAQQEKSKDASETKPEQKGSSGRKGAKD